MRFSLSRTLSVGAYLAHSEVRSRYARSVLGSYWIAIQQAVFVVVAGIVFPGVFGAPVADYVPFFAVSLLFWSFFSSSILEAQDTLIANGPMIRDRGFSPEIFLYAVFLRNLIMSAHAAVVPAAALVVFTATTPLGLVMALPGMALFLATTASLVYLLGILATRFRDLKRASESALQLGFLVTPILWQPQFLEGRRALVIDLNPLAHMFIAWRQPLLEGSLAPHSLAISALVAAAAAAAATSVSRRLSNLAIWI